MIKLDSQSPKPLYMQIYEQIKNQIIEGVLEDGAKLSSTRKLSEQLSVGRNTVENAYLQLASEGYINSQPGSGFRVCHYQEPLSRIKETGAHELKQEPASYRYDFIYGSIDMNSFPLHIWKKCVRKALMNLTPETMTAYGDHKGLVSLREKISAYLNESRGVSCQAEQIVICSGFESAMAILKQLMGRDTQTIAFEDPGYTVGRKICDGLGFKTVSIPLDDDGLNLEALKKSDSKLVYVTPSHQFPMGMVLPINQRTALVKWAVKQNAFIIEDDYDSELRYHSKPIPSIHNLDSEEQVIYLGTFSKLLSPSIRMNYMVLPRSLSQKFDSDMPLYQCSVPNLIQETMDIFMSEGHWERHLRRTLVINRKKHDLLHKAIQNHFGDSLRIYGKYAGLHLVVEYKGNHSEDELIEKAKMVGVGVFPMSLFYTDHTPEKARLILSFGRIEESKIDEGIRLLKVAWS